MKVAFAVWNNRIAPVFDVARQVHIVHSESGQIIREEDAIIGNEGAMQKAVRLAELGVGTLVCGAISRQLLATIAAYGVHVIPFIAGDLREVIQAHLAGSVDWKQYAMPGCRRWRRHAGHPGGYGKSRDPLTGKRK
jgi:predicted Fe-Mo cluster-binding NifX family protein